MGLNKPIKVNINLISQNEVKIDQIGQNKPIKENIDLIGKN